MSYKLSRLFQPTQPQNESEKIQDEVKRQADKCSCVKRFQIHKIGEGKYRVSTTKLGRAYSCVCGAKKYI